MAKVKLPSPFSNFVETPGVEPGSEKEIDGTSTCVAKRLNLTRRGQFGQPLASDPGKYNLQRPENAANRPIISDVHPHPGWVRAVVNG